MLIALWLLAPGILAALYFCRLQKRMLSPIVFLSVSVAFSFLIALFVVGIFYLRGSGAKEWMVMFSSIGRLLKYGALALVAAAALPNMAHLLVKLSVGKKHDEQRK